MGNVYCLFSLLCDYRNKRDYLLSVCKRHFPLPRKGFSSAIVEQGSLNTNCHKQHLLNTGERPSLIASSASDQGWCLSQHLQKSSRGGAPGAVAMILLHVFIPWGQRSFLFAAFAVSWQGVHCMAKGDTPCRGQCQLCLLLPLLVMLPANIAGSQMKISSAFKSALMADTPPTASSLGKSSP